MDAEQIEENVINSFRLVKEDIRKLFEDNKFILEQVKSLKEENRRLRAQAAKKGATKIIAVQPKVVASAKNVAKQVKTFVASKTGKKVHSANCMFARNISKKNRVSFSTKTKALNEGYKLCSCLAY